MWLVSRQPKTNHNMQNLMGYQVIVARDFFEVLISYKNISMIVLKVARKCIGERVNKRFPFHHLASFSD